MMQTFVLVGLLLTIASTVVGSSNTTEPSKLGCKDFRPQGWNSSLGRIYFYDNNPTDAPTAGPGFHAPTLPANASVGPIWQLSSNNANNSGAHFRFRTCNSTSLALSSSATGTCTHGACYEDYLDFVHVVNPYTGHCLTQFGQGRNTSATGFCACDGAPAGVAQLWTVAQAARYTPGFGAVVGYAAIEFANTQPGRNADGEAEAPLYALALSRRDNLTIEVVEFGYTQDGLSANLLEYLS